MSEQASDPDLGGLEQSLARLRPAPAQLDRDQLMFQAGRASVPRRGWAWPSATAALALLAVGLGGLLAVRPGAEIRERVVYVQVPAPAPVAQTPAPSPPVAPASAVASSGAGEYGRLRDQVLRWGVDALPSRSPAVVVSQQASTIGRLRADIEQ